MRITQITTAISEYYILDILRHFEVNKDLPGKKSLTFTISYAEILKEKKYKFQKGFFLVFFLVLFISHQIVGIQHSII
jgi:hypothetical protein